MKSAVGVLSTELSKIGEILNKAAQEAQPTETPKEEGAQDAEFKEEEKKYGKKKYGKKGGGGFL